MPLPPSGSVIGDSRIYAGPHRYGWRRHALQSPDSPPAPAPTPAQRPAAGSVRGVRFWRRGLFRPRGRDAGSDAASQRPEGQGAVAAVPGGGPVVAVPALVEGLPSDGASGSMSGGSSSGALNPAVWAAPAAARGGGDLQLTALRAAEEGTLRPGPDGSAVREDGTAQLMQLQRLRLHRVPARAAGEGPASGLRVGSNVMVGNDVHVGITTQGIGGLP
jgi:hypothetical protein